MMERNFIRNILLSYMKRGVRNYVIYPFGINGIEAKTVLQECFGILPRLIVDNTNSLYNPNIIDFERFKQEVRKDDYVILTIENSQVNAQMEIELEKIVDKERIINLEGLSKKNNVPEDNNLLLRNILPQKEEVSECKGKIKVRMLHTTLSTWNSLKTICVAFQKDICFDVRVILSEVLYQRAEVRAAEEQLRKEGIEYFLGRNYKAEDDKPDIFIISHPWDCSNYYKIRKYTKLIVMASLTLNEPNDSVDNFLDTLRIGVAKYEPDYYMFDTLGYNKLSKVWNLSGKLVHMGNAKYDGIYQACKVKALPREWKKLENKKIILWTTDHGLNYRGIEVPNGLTFDLYAKGIFQYAKVNENIGFIFRPHPTLIIELLNQGYWTVEDLEEMKTYCKNSSNIIYDDTDSYDAAYAASDAMLVDSECGITCSALPTLKPICIPYRSRDYKAYHKEILDSYYSAYSMDDLIVFFEMIQRNEDPMLEKRKEMSEKYVKHFDGQNGERIKYFIEEKYRQL